MKFVEYLEFNDYEGESWRFWLQLDGNTTNLDILADIIKQAEKEENEKLPYFLNKNNIIDEETVDILVKYSFSGYRKFENKITGKLNLLNLKEKTLDETLYKGGITTLFKKEEEMVDNQHKKIVGYRDLSEKDISNINLVKELESQIAGNWLETSKIKDIDLRWLNIAKTHLEEGFSAWVKAIAQPMSPFVE